MTARRLVVDCATPALSVALFEGETCLDACHRELGRGHAEALLPAIATLSDGGFADEILVDIGPGSFWITGAVHYVGGHEITFLNNPNLRNKGQYLVDGSVNYKINNTTLSVFGKNLANEKGWTIGYDVQGVWSYAAPRPPRIWGVALTQTF